ncbi:uncharacterized protein (DUF58 family) [Povalibacter uvarum]|uniref:Uncharacterized protein (DUF58 family) n=1 Tax=Povalibacter uvarum TaxID=732238 RepID=A0A841HH71_9GAMM|nr:DUF58 domain-containing protein [Povalibacter uvarum]MBB6091435.1 uncharacterized protein (DUF58 family) [Povalibacter uvarum]
MLRSLIARLRRRTRAWARKRHGIDADPTVLSGRRIYILPTGLGVVFGLMIFAMFLGAMNYGNNLALGLGFMLGSLGLTAMHYCHRNIASIRVASGASDPVFAGEEARFRVALENDAPLARHEVTIGNDFGVADPVRIEPGSRSVLTLQLPAGRRGYLKLDHFEISTRHPLGLFRAWAHLHMDMTCVVYPRPAARGLAPPPVETDIGGTHESARGDEDFAGLRSFHSGDSPRRIAWKAFARGQGLHVKVYAGTAVASHTFDWESLPGLGTEARLAQLCRWIEDAHAEGRAFGLKLPGVDIRTNIGAAHRQRCLTALALYGLEETQS